MVRTYGLTHIALAVRDLERSVRFYAGVFGARVVYRGAGFVQLQTPGCRDVLVLERSRSRAGKAGGVQHFGYRLRSAGGIAGAADAVVAAGGSVESEGEFVPGEPYLFARDPDGYTVEIWFELPTPVDPRPRRKP
jgi:catechol 2,3-dioxygenase-like lactoylglutathione lyase family enzyme